MERNNGSNGKGGTSGVADDPAAGWIAGWCEPAENSVPEHPTWAVGHVWRGVLRDVPLDLRRRASEQQTHEPKMIEQPTGMPESEMNNFQAFGGTPDTIRPGACAIIRDARDWILLHQRSDNGFWALPGGGLDLGESYAECCVREVREETGLEVEIIRLVGIYSKPTENVIRYPDGSANQSASVLFECRVIGGELQIDHESLKLEWFDPVDLIEHLPEPFFPNHLPRLRDALANRPEAFWR
jgi:ADP-ribose pyrophosphatase YjhB (NUDIX family)